MFVQPSSIFPSTLTSFPIPVEERHSHSMMVPPPFFTVWMVFKEKVMQTFSLAFLLLVDRLLTTLNLTTFPQFYSFKVLQNALEFGVIRCQHVKKALFTQIDLTIMLSEKQQVKNCDKREAFFFHRPNRTGTGFPTQAFCPRVSCLPCETTNLSKSGLPPILLPRTNGEVRGSHSRGAFPRSGHTSHSNPRGRRSKDHIIVPSPQVHPVTCSEPGLHCGC